MALNRNDASKVSYKAKIDWAKERMFQITSDEEALEAVREKSFFEKDLTPDELIEILNDLGKKAKKLEDHIDYLSAKLTIPIDPEKEPDIAKYVAQLDSTSKGEYISYKLYISLLEQKNASYNDLNINNIAENSTGDPDSDSILINSLLSSGMESGSDIRPPNYPKDNSLERYINRYLNNIFSWNEHDYHISQILNFADNYLGMFPDPAYIPWYSRKDVSWEKKEINSLEDLWSNFSDNYKSQATQVIDGVKNLAALRPNLESAKTLNDISKRYVSYVNDFMNGLNDTFGFNYAADLLCCFFQWAGRLDTKTLKGLRALLQLLKTGLSYDFTDIINSIKDIINNIFRGLLLNQVMGMINQISQRLVDPIKRWINNPNPAWQRIFICTPVDELINRFVVDAIEFVQNQLASLLRKFYKKYELKNIDFTLKGTLIGEQKRLGTLIQMLDTVISVLEKSAICGTLASTEAEPVKKIMEAYNIGPNKPYIYPGEEKPTIYNSFIPTTPTEENIKKEATASSSTTITEKFDTSTERGGGKFDACLKKMMPEDFKGVTNWFEAIKSGSNRS